MATEYGTRLRQARKRAGLNQLELAKKTGIAQSTVSTAERLGNGSGDTAAYAQACGVSDYWLETGQGEMLPATATATLSAPSPTLSESNHPLSCVYQAQEAINGVASFGQTLQCLAHHLANVDPIKREAATGVMVAFMRNPDDLSLLSALTTLLIPAEFVYPDRKRA